jgi:ATP-dependent helicase/nuclease subunit A
MMRAPEQRVCDQDVRDRVTGDLGTTFLLEAGAGTGKTRVLVERYVRCVLDEDRGTGDVRSVAAITFTEKAAGELRQRVREAFEARATGVAKGSSEADAIERALDALDDAPIATIHGFAGRLLREFPVEAAVDPAFEQLDQFAAEIEHARLWEEWLTMLAADAPEREAGGAAAGPGGVQQARVWLGLLLRVGVKLDAVRELAVGAKGVFGERYDLDAVSQPPDPPDLRAAIERLAAPLASLKEHCMTACSNSSDRGCCAALDLVERCELLAAQSPDGLNKLAAALFDLPIKNTPAALGGAKGNWNDALGGKDELQARYGALAEAIVLLRDGYAEFVGGLAVAVADAFSRWAGATQLGLGRLDFTDLLGCLRDLLAVDMEARGALQQRFRYLLVDEFQDTDPLQAEIVFLLCEREPLAGDWREVVLEPGKLFVVGDPKQSIYRFRRADISLYDEVKTLVASQPNASGVHEVIRQNFRTTPAVLAWVNNVFADVFDGDQAEGRQPSYQWVDAYRPAAIESGVSVLLGREYVTQAAGERDAARRDEARALAALLREMHERDDARWQVQDRGIVSGGELGHDGEATRSPRWSDICLLFRTTTGLETYEQALREAGVPYRVDGGKTYFARREVADALLCLRAVDDPCDGPALYGALHSSFFGFSDDDLFLFWAAGGRFDLFAADQPKGHEAIAGAMATLRALHEHRADWGPHEMAGELVRRAQGREFLAATGPGAAQAIANVEKLVERARAFAGAGGGSLGAFLSWASQAGDAAGEQESQVDDEGDAVRLLTIHKAKGLEYPIVVLVGGALPSGGGGKEAVNAIVDRHSRRLAVRLRAELPGMAGVALASQVYKDLAGHEKQMAASEMRRLLYVAATRARDRLVVTCFGRLATQKGEAAENVMLAPIRHALPAPGSVPPDEEYRDCGLLVLAPAVPLAAPAAGEAPRGETLVATRRTWLAEHRKLLEHGIRGALSTSPSGLERVDEEVRKGGSGAPPGRASALALGSAVHRIMELCDLTDESSVERLAFGVTRGLGRQDLAQRAAELAVACWRSAPLRAAAASLEVYRELPVGVTLDGVIVNGAIDLLYRDGDQWVIVDYKTDRDVEGRVLRERYAPQGAAYAVAVEAATGGVVREVALVAAARGGEVVSVTVDDELRGLANREVGAAALEGRAIAGDELGQAS